MIWRLLSSQIYKLLQKQAFYSILHYILMLVCHINIGEILFYVLQMEIFTIFILLAFYDYLQTLPDLTQ